MGAKGWIAATVAVALAAGGYAAWTYSGSGGRDRAAGEGSNAAPAANDAALIAAQGYCPVMPDTKLGEMGEPFKVMVKGATGVEQPVFVCCKGCRRKALADPDKTLAKVAELKAVGAAGPK